MNRGPTTWRLGYRPALDGLRGVAVLLVVGQHALVPGFSRSGTVGVTIFFVLSGFLITSLLLEEQRGTGRINIASFWIRRARRLLPALALFLAVMAIVGVPGVTLIAVALYSGNWWHVGPGDLGLLRHTWTLAVEEQFYVLWPLVFLMFGGAPRRLLVTAALVCLAARAGTAVLAEDRTFAFYSSFTRLDALAIGCLLAARFERGPWRPPEWLVWAAIPLLVVPSVVEDLEVLLVAGIPMATAGAVVLVAHAATTGPSLLSNAVLVRTGAISYGIYLWHGPLVAIATEGHLGVLAAIGLVLLAVCLAVLSHYLVERPFMRRRSAVLRSTYAPAR